MNPKGKAIELVERMQGFYHSFMYGSCEIDREQAKRTALICVDEIIEALKITTGHCTLRLLDRQEVQSDFEYWQEVKQEIERL